VQEDFHDRPNAGVFWKPRNPITTVNVTKEWRMVNLRLGLMSILAGAASLAAACNSDNGGGAPQRSIDSTEATATMNQRIDRLVGGLGDSTAKMDMAGSTGVASRGINSALGSSSACPADSNGGTTNDATGTLDDTPESTTQALDDLLHQLAKEARDHVFREEFVEVKDGKQVIYKIAPTSACGTNTTCISKLTENPIRFVVTARSDDSLDVSLLVGEARYNPGDATLSDNKISMRANLAEVMNALRLFADPEDQKDFPDRLQGVIEGAIEKRGEGNFAISGSVIEQFDLLVNQAKGKPVEVKILPTTPTCEITINAPTNTLGYSLNVGAVDVSIAGAAVCDSSCGSKEKSGTFTGHLAGSTGAFTVTKDATELTFSNLGLGSDTSYVALDNDRLGTLDVNPNNGRKFSMTFKKTAEGTVVTFEPALDIKLALMLNKLSDSMRVDMPEWLSNEIFEIILGGAAKPSLLIPAPTCDSSGRSIKKNQLQATSGALTLTSSSLPAAVDVTTGMCLLPVTSSAESPNPFSQVKAGACQ
jgi:hypothetical protein